MTWYMIGALLLGEALLYYISAVNLKKMKSEERQYYDSRAQQQDCWMKDRDKVERERILTIEAYARQREQHIQDLLKVMVDRVKEVEKKQLKMKVKK